MRTKTQDTLKIDFKGPYTKNLWYSGKSTKWSPEVNSLISSTHLDISYAPTLYSTH